MPIAIFVIIVVILLLPAFVLFFLLVRFLPGGWPAVKGWAAMLTVLFWFVMLCPT
jgi:hypothetical protein